MYAEMWGEYFPEEEGPVFLSATEIRAWSRPQVMRRILPSRWERLKYKLVSLRFGLKFLGYAYWRSFLHWRRFANTKGARNFRALEFAVMFVGAALLFEGCVVEFCKQISGGR